MRTRTVALSCVLWCAAGIPSASGDDAPVTAEQIRALVERLEQAETKISQLQAELEETRAAQPQPFPAGDVPALTPLNPFQPTAASYFDDPATTDALTAQLQTLREEQAALSESHQKLSDDYASLSEGYDALTADLSKGKGVVLPGGSNATVTLTGRLHADYWTFPDTDAGDAVLEGMDPQDRFGFRRIRVGVQGKIKDNMVYKIETEIPNPHDFEWRDVYLGFTDLPVLQTVLIGNQKRPYGLDHLNSSRYNIFIERPFVVEAINEDARRLGITSYGVSEDLRYNWRYGVYEMDKTQDSDDFYISDHYQLEVAGRLASTYWWDETSDGRGYGHFAVAGTVAHPDGGAANNAARFFTRPEARTSSRWIDTGQIAGAEWYEVIAAEHVLNIGPLQLVGEAQNVFLQREGGSDLNFWGAYGYVAYMLTGEHVPWDRETGIIGRVKPFENFFLVDCCDGGHGGGWGAWQVAARYSHGDFSSDDVLGGVGNAATLALVWYWNSNASMQFNWVHGVIDDSADLNAAGLSDARYDILGVRMRIDY